MSLLCAHPTCSRDKRSSGLIPCGLSGSESGGPGCSGISGSKSGFTFGFSGRSSGGSVGDSGDRKGDLSGGVGFWNGCTGSGVLPGGWLGLRRTVLLTKYLYSCINGIPLSGSSLSSWNSDHFSAGIRTGLAGLCADAAMLHTHGGMFATFFGTRVADVGTKLAIGFGKLAVHLHHAHCYLTGRRTFLVQPDTVPQRVDIVFFQTGIRTLIAHRGTIGTRIDTGLILYIRHNGKFDVRHIHGISAKAVPCLA
jgi:hypothetical protein